MDTEMNRETQIANAFVAIAEVNHYMVGFINVATLEELQKAEQILIVRSNKLDNKNAILEFALQLIGLEIAGIRKLS
jgi:hypothetical protein